MRSWRRQQVSSEIQCLEGSSLSRDRRGVAVPTSALAAGAQEEARDLLHPRTPPYPSVSTAASRLLLHHHIMNLIEVILPVCIHFGLETFLHVLVLIAKLFVPVLFQG